MKKVVIMRGVPGSGKSTYARTRYPHAVICSADHFFQDGDEYKFDREKLGEAHRECMRQFLSVTEDVVPLGGNTVLAKPLVVVDNTNIRHWEYAGYVQVAQARGYEVEVVMMDTPVEVAATRCVHGVSEGRVRKMSKGMEPTPGDLQEVVVKDGRDPREDAEYVTMRLRYAILKDQDLAPFLAEARAVMKPWVRVGALGLDVAFVIDTEDEDPVHAFDSLAPLRMAGHVVLRRSTGQCVTWKSRYREGDLRFSHPADVAQAIDAGYPKENRRAA